jgi:hypothetical protein
MEEGSYIYYIEASQKRRRRRKLYIYIEGIDDAELVMEEMPSVREPPIHSQLQLRRRVPIYISRYGCPVALCSDQYQQYRVCVVYTYMMREKMCS